MQLLPTDSEMSVVLDDLTDEDMELLTRKFKMSDIETWISEIMNILATEAKSRIQSKIAILLNHGYGTGALFNSVFYKIQGDQITLSSTKNYFAILNAGFPSFNIAEALKDKGYSFATMRLPGGRVIHRKLPKNIVNPKKKASFSSRRWVHPGFRGVHIYQAVAEEMQVFSKEMITEKINSLKREASTSLPDSYSYIQGLEKTYYSVRDTQGRFAKTKAEKSPHQVMMENNSAFYYTYNENGSVSADMKRGMEFTWEQNRTGWYGED